MFMLRSIFTKSLRDESRPLLWWSLGLTGLMLYLLLFYPTVRDNSSYGDLIKAMPDSLKAILSLTEDPTSPGGYLSAEFLSLTGPLMFMISAIAQGAHAVAGEEERRTLDLLLANPVPRAKVVAEKFAAMAATLCALGLVVWVVLWLGGAAVGMHLGALGLAAAIVNIVLLALFFGALALLVGCASGKHGASIGIPAAVGLAGYVWYSVGSSVASLKPYRAVSPFYHYIAGRPLQHGFTIGHEAVLVVGMLVCFGLAVITFDRRDLAV